MSRDLKHRSISLAVAFMAAALMVVDLCAFPRSDTDGLGRLTSAAYSETTKRDATTAALGTPSYSASYTYGTPGSVRLDIAVYDQSGKLVYVFDIKTGNAKLTNSQIQKIRNNTVSNLPVTEIKIE